MATMTTNLSDTWSRRAMQAEEPKRNSTPPTNSNGYVNGTRRPAPNKFESEQLNALALTPRELEALAQKGIVFAPGKAAPIPKEVLDLVRLGHPADGWSVLLGLITVTPQLADRWLKNNFNNRPVVDDVVTAYARDAAAGVFLTTHQGIAFNDRDELIDGQHRLLAIAKSGVPCVLMVSFGWLSEIPGKALKRMDLIDRGRMRSVPDQLKIQHGLKDGAAIAQTCNCIANLCYGERTRRISVNQVLDIFHEFEPAVLYVIERRSKLHGLKSAGVLGAFAFALALQSDKKKVLADGHYARWFEDLNHGTGRAEVPTSPIHHLRAFLTSEDAKLMTRSLDRGIAELVLQAVRFEQDGKQIWTPKALLEDALAGADWFRAQQKERVAKIAALFKLPK